MENTSLEAISSFRSIVLLEVNFGKDPLRNHIRYVFSDFSIAGLPNYKTLSEILSDLDPQSEVCEGLGFQAYQKEIKESLHTVFKSGKSTSFLLPLTDGSASHPFIVKVKKNGEALSFLFFLLHKDAFIDLDTYAADTFKDKLTGLFNFNTFRMHLEACKAPGFICLFDLNKFKAINDTFGHEVGDDVLILTASFMISIASQDEIFYRRSGDEFLIYFLKHDYNYAMGVIESVENYLTSLSKGPLKQHEGLEVSASFGLLEIVNSDNTDLVDIEDKMKLIDLAMYQAKKCGRTCHYISYNDSLQILKSGDLDRRLKALAISIKR